MTIVGLTGIVHQLSPPSHCVTFSAGMGDTIRIPSEKAKLINFSNNQPVSPTFFPEILYSGRLSPKTPN